MNYEWDEKKRAANLEKHGLDFLRAIKVLENEDLLVVRDDRKNYGEERLIAYGRFDGRVYVVVYAQHRPEIMRLISFRKANRREVLFYEKALSRGT
jgi:uncharacterized protein